ncbi:DUF5906 domain-containing protein [Comamonas sp.]|uniref:DUF5906 domain-containing protein n=1 Tax=Comamonas sp. TaxID=34028 RepID=UPI00289C3BB6|nr:DUF5906 domain-containing protein [Comamonas sp.]
MIEITPTCETLARRNHAPPTVRTDTERIRSALQFLNPHNRDTWVKMAFAIKSEMGDYGFEIWDEWGAAHKRPASEVKSTWKSAKPGGKVGLGSLIYDAKAAGWKDDAKYQKPSPEVIALREAAAAARKAQFEAEETAEQEAAATRAQALWDEAQPTTEHDYLTRKGVQSHGLRYGPFEFERTNTDTGEVSKVRMKALLVPLYDHDGKLRSLQAISRKPGGDKLLLSGGKMVGNFFPFGKPKEINGRQVFILGEGYATCASIYEGTGHMVLMCVNSGNILHVAKSIRERDAEAIIVIAGDNDIWNRKADGTPHNPGRLAADKAAKAVDGIVALPPFTEADATGASENGNPIGPKDFNDWYTVNGPYSVKEVIEAALQFALLESVQQVVLVPSRAEAWGVAYALECFARLESVQPRLFVMPCDRLGIQQAAERASTEHPGASLLILTAPGCDAEAQAVGEQYGGRVEPPPTGVGEWHGWGELYLDALFDAIEGHVDAGLREKVEQALARLAQKAQAEPPASAVDVAESGVDGEQIPPTQLLSARDEDRRRQQQQDDNKRLQYMDAGAMIPSELTVDEMIERCVWIAEGQNVAYVTEDRSMFLKAADFSALTVSSKTEVEVQQGEKIKKKWMANSSLWKSDFRRVDAMTATFHPGAPIITANPKGSRAVNTWRPIRRWHATADISLFLEQVEYLFPDPTERNAFLDWLAHIEQKPGELPHYGWLHIAENTGTGRNWMASVLARVFRGYVAPNVDLPALLDSPYNGELGGCVLAIVDEVQEGASEGNYRHAERLKSMVNAEMRTVNNKYGMKYLEFNALRWLVFSNHKNALPLSDEDRRFRVVMHKAPPRAPAVYERLYAMLQDAEFINAIGVYLSERDIRRFKPGERPPLNADKLAAIAASKPMTTQGAEEIVEFWPADVITNKHVIELLTGASEKKDFTPAMRRAMEEAGAQAWQQGKANKIKIGTSSHRAWVLRNHGMWLTESTDAARKEISRAGVDDLNKPAAVVLADAAEVMERLREPPI